MDSYLRHDGRYYHMQLCRSLLGLEVMIAHGGLTPARVRSIPVADVVEGERVMEALARRRIAHGYRRVPEWRDVARQIASG